MSTDNLRKCVKCGLKRKDDLTITYHRFPKYTKRNKNKIIAWAKYCWPETEHSEEFLSSLQSNHKVLCGRHFADNQFYDNKRQVLGTYAVPGIYKMPEMKVSSEIHDDFNYKTSVKPKIEGNVISEFPLTRPSESEIKYDKDGDLDTDRPEQISIIIEHSPSTNLSLVGLQVWRGAFLLGDLIIHMGTKGLLTNKNVLELGGGTGLTSFVAAMYAEKVVCTDIDIGGILPLIKLNLDYNKTLIRSEFKVMPLDFTNTTWNQELLKEIEQTDIILAADVIYDDDITAAFTTTLQKILNTKPPKTLYVALEKRYVFTIEHMDSIAPCYETFLLLLDKVKDSKWTVKQINLDFPKYFKYDRVNELVLWEISSVKGG